MTHFPNRNFQTDLALILIQYSHKKINILCFSFVIFSVCVVLYMYTLFKYIAYII